MCAGGRKEDKVCGELGRRGRCDGGGIGRRVRCVRGGADGREIN